MRLLMTLVAVLILFAVEAQTKIIEHGTVQKTGSADPGAEHEVKYQAWNQELQSWTSIEDFWAHYAKSSGGLTWGQVVTYPKYSDVKEGDTMIVVLDQGVCMMEFFHSRWRRANDVRRWDDAFNDYGGCPYVFQ